MGPGGSNPSPTAFFLPDRVHPGRVFLLGMSLAPPIRESKTGLCGGWT